MGTFVEIMNIIFISASEVLQEFMCTILFSMKMSVLIFISCYIVKLVGNDIRGKIKKHVKHV